MNETLETYWRTYVVNGGVLMFALIPCSFIVVAAILQAMIRLRPGRVAPDYILKAAARCRNRGDRAAFAKELEGQTSPLARALVVIFGEIDPSQPRHPHRRTLDAATTEGVAYVADDMYEDLSAFGTLYTIGPLLGLLGTILGMVKAFLSFGTAEQQDLAALSNGIQEALITTLWGLAVAIPAFLAAQTFQSRVRKFERGLLPAKAGEVIRAMYGEAGAAAEESPDEEALPAPAAGGEPETPSESAPEVLPGAGA